MNDHPTVVKAAEGRVAPMRFLIIAAAVLQASISAEAKLVWGAIYFLARPMGICSAFYREIGTLVGINKRAVMRAIPELTEPGLVVDLGGGNGEARRFRIPDELLAKLGHLNFETSAQAESVRKQNRSRNGTDPVPKLNRTTTETVPPYKEEINNNNKSASADAETSLSLVELQQKWFDEEFWPPFWRKRDKAEAFKTFKRHAPNQAKKNQVIAALKAESPEMVARQVQHRPYAATWLNKRRYEDDMEEVQSSANDPASLYMPAEDDE